MDDIPRLLLLLLLLGGVRLQAPAATVVVAGLTERCFALRWRASSCSACCLLPSTR